MIDPTEYVVSDDAVISDVDLDTEVVRLKDGRRLTNELAEQLAEEALADARRRNLVPGRKSLSGGTVHSPRVQFRVPDSLRAAAEQRAAEKGVSLSELAREALEHYLAS
jgi:predicted HicB family RNase H-like nuclease